MSAASPRQYEFTPDQNSVIGALAARMRTVGMFLIIIAVVNFLLQYSGLTWTHLEDVLKRQLGAGNRSSGNARNCLKACPKTIPLKKSRPKSTAKCGNRL